METPTKQLEFTRTARTGNCRECGGRTCMCAIVRDNAYPYVHRVFECAKCTKEKASGCEHGIAREHYCLDCGREI